MKINEEEEGNPVKATIHQQQNPLSNYNDQVNKGDRPTNNESKTHKQRPSCLFTHLSLFIAEQPNTRTRALSTPLSFVFLSFPASYPSPARTGIRNKLQLNPSRSAQCLAHLNPLLSFSFLLLIWKGVRGVVLLAFFAMVMRESRDGTNQIEYRRFFLSFSFTQDWHPAFSEQEPLKYP